MSSISSILLKLIVLSGLVGNKHVSFELHFRVYYSRTTGMNKQLRLQLLENK